LETAVKSYNQEILIKDPLFEIEKLSQYTLCLLISRQDFSFSVIDNDLSRCVRLEKFQFNSLFSVQQLLEQLELIFDDHHFLKAGYWGDIKLGVKNRKFTFLPKSLFDSQQQEEYLEFNCKVDSKNNDVVHFHHKSLDLVSVFATEKELMHWLESVYSGKKITPVHQTSSLIEGVLRYSDKSEDRQMFINCDGIYLTIVILAGGQLEFCNIFRYRTAEDLTYYTMFVFNELGMNPEETEVTMWGNIDQTSIHFTKLFRFIRYLSFGERPSNLKFGYVFDEIFEHNQFDVLNLHNCG
jgi:hypothetical protein